LINACTDMGCGLGVFVGFGDGVALGRAEVAEVAGVCVDARLGPGEVVCLLGSVVGSPTLHATMSTATGSTRSAFT
jgi:hypothetical protein